MKCRVILLTIVLSLLLTACGASGTNGYAASTENYSEDYYESAAAYEESYDSDIYGYAAKGASLNSMDEEVAEEVAEGDFSDDKLPVNSNRKLIRTVNMSVETRDFDALIENIQNKIKSLGGYAESMSVNGNAKDTYSRRNAYITARIPADKLDQFVNGVEKESNILNKSENAEDVTLSYSDVEAHKESLRVEQDRLNDLLKEADSIETIIALEARLSEVRYELESYESRLRTMDNQIEYSTVYLDVMEVKEYKPEPIEDPTFGERIVEGFTDGLSAAEEMIQDFVVGLVEALPVLLVIVVILGVFGFIVFIIVKIIIKLVKKSKTKKQLKMQEAAKKVAVKLDSPPESTDKNNN